MKLKTIEIRHKNKSGVIVVTPYVTVSARLKHFRESGQYEEYQLLTEIIQHDDDSCLIKALIINPKGVVISTGHAYERTAQGFINKTSHVENCETSAVGRALAIFGIGIDEEVRSYEEMTGALDGQKTPKKKKEKESVCADEQTISKNDIETILIDCTTIEEVTQVWWKLTAQQQKDKDIKFYFTARKGQLNA